MQGHIAIMSHQPEQINKWRSQLHWGLISGPQEGRGFFRSMPCSVCWNFLLQWIHAAIAQRKMRFRHTSLGIEVYIKLTLKGPSLPKVPFPDLGMGPGNVSSWFYMFSFNLQKDILTAFTKDHRPFPHCFPPSHFLTWQVVGWSQAFGRFR